MASGNISLLLWQESESPYALVMGVIEQFAGAENVKVGLSSAMRFFIVNGFQKVDSANISLEPTGIIDQMRTIKSPTELAILDCANRATKESISAVAKRMRIGMSANKIKQMLVDAQTACGLTNIWHLVLVGSNAAYPHVRNSQNFHLFNIIFVL